MSVLDMFKLEGKKGFITGGSRGIGFGIAEAFAEVGADLALVAMNMEIATKAAKELSDKYGRKVIAIQCDVRKEDDVNRMMETFINEFGTIDFAINNAGIANVIEADKITPDDFREVIDINLNGVFLTAQAAAKQMIKEGKKGAIVSTASMSGHIVNIPQTIANYCAAKAGVIHLTKALAVEWAEYGIRVNTVSPGYIGTELVASLEDWHPIWLDKIPMKRLGEVKDLIGAYLFLASDASQYATGTDLVVDGGYICL